jgi:uncharacterized membrane protein YdbT with pleckstrin-like domain
MTANDNILLKPAMPFAFLKAYPLLLLAATFLLLAWWLSPYFLVVSFTVSVIAWYRLCYIRSIRYLVTTEYIRLTRGIIFRRVDQVEMFRVKDYIITQPLIMQLFRLMHLTLKSTDPENPVITFMGIPESGITDTIRDRVQEARKNNKIFEIN